MITSASGRYDDEGEGNSEDFGSLSESDDQLTDRNSDLQHTTQIGSPKGVRKSLKQHQKSLDRMSELKLVQLAQRGDKHATEDLTDHFMNFIKHYAESYSSNSVGREFQDLVQQGVLGLLIAIKKFDHAKIRIFEPYAKQCVLRSILHHVLYFCDSIRWTKHQHQLQTKIAKATAKMSFELGRSPTNNEIAACVGLTRKALQEAQIFRMLKSVSSIDELSGDFDDESVLDSLSGDAMYQPEVIAEIADTSEFVESLLDRLRPQELTVLELKSKTSKGKIPSFETIGNLLGISKQYAQETHGNAISKLSTWGEDELENANSLLHSHESKRKAMPTDKKWVRLLPSSIPDSIRYELYYFVLAELERHLGCCNKDSLISLVAEVAKTELSPSVWKIAAASDNLTLVAVWIFWAIQHLQLFDLLREAYKGKDLAITNKGRAWLGAHQDKETEF